MRELWKSESTKVLVKARVKGLNLGICEGNFVVFATIFHSFRDILISNCSRLQTFIGNLEISIEINRNQLRNKRFRNLVRPLGKDR